MTDDELAETILGHLASIRAAVAGAPPPYRAIISRWCTDCGVTVSLDTLDELVARLEGER